jgi:hypothetical protein
MRGVVLLLFIISTACEVTKYQRLLIGAYLVVGCSLFFGVTLVGSRLYFGELLFGHHQDVHYHHRFLHKLIRPTQRLKVCRQVMRRLEPVVYHDAA